MNQKAKLHLERSISLLDQSFGGQAHSTPTQKKEITDKRLLESELNRCQIQLRKSKGEVQKLRESNEILLKMLKQTK